MTEEQSLVVMQRELETTGALTPVGLRLTQEMSYERYEALLFLLGTYHTAYQWAVGDALVYGEQVFGEESFQASEALRMSPDTRNRYRRVAERIPRDRRRAELSWSHHFVVSHLQPGDQIDWLDRAVRNNYSKNDLEELIKMPKEIVISKGEEEVNDFITCPHCGSEIDLSDQ